MARPKSEILATRPAGDWPIRMFSGLMSRWTKPSEWACSSPLSTWLAIRQAWLIGYWPGSALARASRLVPATYSIVNQNWPRVIPCSSHSTMLGCLSWLMTDISRRNRSIADRVAALSGTISLRATIRPVWLFLAWKTTPIPPRPSWRIVV